jgi:phage-related protein
MRLCQFWPKVWTVASGAVRVAEEGELTPKPVMWLGDSRRKIKTFPEDVQNDMGAALFWAQLGAKHPDAKPLQGFGGAGVLEIVESDDGSTYRAVYTVKFEGRIYVLHCFQKKSKKEDKTPQHDVNLIRERLKQAEKIHREVGKKGRVS